MATFEMDKVTASALAEFERTDVGITLLGWMDALIAERKERLVRHRGIASIPDMWHDQGFIEGIRNALHIFEHAKAVRTDWDDEPDELAIDIPEPAYLGANPDNPRR